MHYSTYSLLHRHSPLQRLASAVVTTALTASALMIPAAAQSTYVIHDRDEVIVHTTFTRDPDEVLQEAGVTLGRSDVYTAAQGADGLDLTVLRRQTVHLVADGQVHTLATYGEPVSQVLDAVGVTLDSDDKSSVPLDTPTETGMTIVITRVETKTLTYEETVPAGEQVFHNNILQPGQETVLEEGSDGMQTVTAAVTYENGVEVSRTVTDTNVTTEAKDRIVIRGAESAAMPTDAEGNAIVTAGGEVLEYERVINGKATAYNCPGYVGHTASGTVAEVGKVAVDPSVIPLGSKLYIVSQDGQYVYGYCIAEDTGGLIKGNKVDLYFSTWDECIQFGYRPVTIYVVEE